MSLAAVIGSLPPFLSFLQSTEKKVGSGKKGKLTFNVHFFKLREKPCRYHDHHDLNDLKAVYFCMPDRKFWKTCMTHLPNGFTIHNRCKNMNENTFLASIWLEARLLWRWDWATYQKQNFKVISQVIWEGVKYSSAFKATRPNIDLGSEGRELNRLKKLFSSCPIQNYIH